MHGTGKRRRKAVVVWTDDGWPFACADAVVTLVLAWACELESEAGTSEDDGLHAVVVGDAMQASAPLNT